MSSAYGTRYENRYCLAMKDLLYGLSRDQYLNPQSVFNLMLTRKLHFLSVSNRNLHVLITGAELKIFIERQLRATFRCEKLTPFQHQANARSKKTLRASIICKVATLFGRLSSFAKPDFAVQIYIGASSDTHKTGFRCGCPWVAGQG